MKWQDSWVDSVSGRPMSRKAFVRNADYVSPNEAARLAAGLPPIKYAWAEMMRRPMPNGPPPIPRLNLVGAFSDLSDSSDDELLALSRDRSPTLKVSPSSSNKERASHILVKSDFERSR